MNIPPEILEIRCRHIDKAKEASVALQAGFITIGEYTSIFSLALDWCDFIYRWQFKIDTGEEDKNQEPICPSCFVEEVLDEHSI